MSINFRAFAPHNIRLGQEERPVVNRDHQSARPGLFICGDLAGHPTLQTSIKDGTETARAVANWFSGKDSRSPHDYDVVICGAGAAGISAALEARQLKLRAVVLEKSRIANTIVNFPAGKKIWVRQEDLTRSHCSGLITAQKKSFCKSGQQLFSRRRLLSMKGKKSLK